MGFAPGISMIDDRNALSQALSGSPQGFIDHWLAQASIDPPASLAMPMIGTPDPGSTQLVMQTLPGIDPQGVITKATLADALQLAMRRTGYTVARADA
jgi:hypothetical protein